MEVYSLQLGTQLQDQTLYLQELLLEMEYIESSIVLQLLDIP